MNQTKFNQIFYQPKWQFYIINYQSTYYQTKDAVYWVNQIFTHISNIKCIKLDEWSTFHVDIHQAVHTNIRLGWKGLVGTRVLLIKNICRFQLQKVSLHQPTRRKSCFCYIFNISNIVLAIAAVATMVTLFEFNHSN